MASEKMQILERAGLDVEGALARLMNNEGFYLRMLGKFADDKSFAGLGSAHEAQDHEGMQQAAHALKGVSATLGMTGLSDLCERMQYTMEGKEQNDPEALMAQIREAYWQALDAVKEAVS